MFHRTMTLTMCAVLMSLGVSVAQAQDKTPPDTSKSALQPPIDNKKMPTTSSTSMKPSTGTGENKQTPTGGQPGGIPGKS